ncbi:hypothetical protein PF005_g17896 [Phytophthora fragariae]|uniref:Uncharacterized protein n=1 Tax=Phytophthora fragariae TaxID=53985 RepID=A0A6A4CXN0_9STRA|nr:hypothetical protein PF009_g20810 [Phytophthora fragariae]KAE8989413.1 hypothetical protein PF011_g18781 [Phytophthora fragariae]KAE9089377.1 hypothetical protein PF010_g19014 [Phytophthora fragariae]KAE9091258.1 hypothetical protein PF007_g18945 [Phytophthora fragariae]KAE9193909.1 hypothetical protein PF005_g17896 [Phytophthora fragariae]
MFAPPPATTYRYIIRLKNDKLSIWMEDRTSKKQWYKDGMVKSDYISSANSVTDAAPADYLKCFCDALHGELDESGDASRKLKLLKGGGFRLELGIRIRVLRSSRVAVYSFDLDPVSVERIDILESKVRDQQDELQRLREGFDVGQELSFIRLEAKSKDASSSNLLWQEVETSGFSVDDKLGEVKIHWSGAYSVVSVVNWQAYGSNQAVLLLKNNEVVQTSLCVRVNNCSGSSTLSTVARLKEDDLVTVKCDANVVDVCYLSITRLGR